MKLLTILSAIVLLAYPFAVYYGLNQWGVGTVAAVLGVLFILRIIGGNKTRLRELKYIAWVSGAMGLVLALLAITFKDTSWFTYYPVIVNMLMLTLFACSLWQKESMVERFARLQEPELPDYAVSYTRSVTKVWCLFFVINGSVSLLTSFLSLDIWTLYNGLISYLLAGSLFAAEFLVRIYVKRKNE
ncbi:septation protein IspZ [Psychromonas aquimarina]|uniref:septation protein IspZ n=1 Tax=Psychromonas aquimarina TaxID=444919 RepID=UPI0003FB9282|nr:septation protein IspZ [Psychromonas aquimarina]